MDVALVGDDPAIEAVDAALGDVGVTVDRSLPGDLDDPDLAVVSGVAGADAFDVANDRLARETPWLSIEIGGLGGVGLADVDAGITLYGRSCYDCLCTRVQGRDDVPTATPSGDRSAIRLAGATAGREAVRVLAGEEGTLDSVIEIPHWRRELLPVPNCCGADRDLHPSREFTAREIEATADAAERAVDERIGPVVAVGEAESFPAPYYLAQLAGTDRFSDASVPEQAAGVDDGWNSAYVKAVGEGLERYASSVYRTEQLDHGTPAAVAETAPVVAPARFAAADDDAPDADDDDHERYWIQGESLADGTEHLLPAQSVLFPPPESPDLPSITTGLGLGSSPAGALISGLTEVIERDATMLAWYSTFEPLGLRVEDDGFERLARRARSEDLSVTTLLVTQDIDVPVVSVAVHRDDGFPQFALGSAAGLDPIGAARSALAEAIQNWMELRSVGPEEAESLGGAIGRYARFPSSARELVDVDESVPAATVGPADPPSGGETVDILVDRLGDADLDAYATRLTTRDLSVLDFEAVRVVVPQAQPLFTGEPYFGERAERVPVELGFEPRLDREYHPYP